MSKTELDLTKDPEDLSSITRINTSIDDGTFVEMAFWETVYRDILIGAARRDKESISDLVSDYDLRRAAVIATTAVLRRRKTFPHLTK